MTQAFIGFFLTLWLSHFASCLPSLQQAPFQLAQAPPPLHLRPLHRVGPSPLPVHLAYSEIDLQRHGLSASRVGHRCQQSCLHS